MRRSVMSAAKTVAGFYITTYSALLYEKWSTRNKIMMNVRAGISIKKVPPGSGLRKRLIHRQSDSSTDVSILSSKTLQNFLFHE